LIPYPQPNKQIGPKQKGTVDDSSLSTQIITPSETEKQKLTNLARGQT
jgi:hypothetical protein